jgi:hypothetical protein
MDDSPTRSCADPDPTGLNREPPTVLDGLRAQLARLPRADAGGLPAVGLTPGELEAVDVHISPRQVDALVALGILGRRRAEGQSRIAWIWDAADPSAVEVETVSPSASEVESASASAVEVEVESVSPSAVEVEVESVSPPAVEVESVSPPAVEVESVSPAARRDEEFQLDLAADYEHERLLMYRVILAFEAVAALLVIREIATGLF